MSARSSTILIYAELLSNIRQVSVGCSLQTESSSSTQAVVSPDGLSLSLRHHGVERSLQLPGRVVAPERLPPAKRGLKSLTWRLPIAPTTVVANARPAMEDQSVPWSARDLEPGAAVSCRACKAVLVEAGVTVALGAQGTMGQRELSTWATRNLRFDAGQVGEDSSYL